MSYLSFGLLCEAASIVAQWLRHYATSLKVAGSRPDEVNAFFSILPAALGPGVHSASNRNEYQKQEKKCFWGEERGRCVGLTTLPPSVSRLSRQ
jgi:hypothetical protein